MSKAQICDRCGKVYSPQYNLAFMDFNAKKIRYGYDYGKDTDYICIDLCNECGKDFEHYLDMKKPIEITRTDNTDHNEEEC